MNGWPTHSNRTCKGTQKYNLLHSKEWMVHVHTRKLPLQLVLQFGEAGHEFIRHCVTTLPPSSQTVQCCIVLVKQHNFENTLISKNLTAILSEILLIVKLKFMFRFITGCALVHTLLKCYKIWQKLQCEDRERQAHHKCHFKILITCTYGGSYSSKKGESLRTEYEQT